MERTHPDSFLQRVISTVAQGMVAQAASHGITSMPEKFAGEVMIRAVNAIRAMPGDKLRDLSMANRSFAQTVATSFETVYSDLPPAERLALRGVRDPASAAGQTSEGPAGGQWINGRWVLGAYGGMAAAAGFASRDGAGTSSRDYATMSGTWNPSSGGVGLNEQNFAGTPFARAGLDLGMTQSLYRQGFNQPQTLAAASDAKALGFSPKDKDAVKDHAIIRKYDTDADGTNAAMQEKAKLEEAHKDELRGLLDRQAGARTAEQKKAAQDAIDAFHKRYADQSGVTARMHDPDRKPQVIAAMGRRVHAKESQLHSQIRAEHAARAGADKAQASTDAKADAFFNRRRSSRRVRTSDYKLLTFRPFDFMKVQGSLRSGTPVN